MKNNTLLFVTRRDPLDQVVRSMVSQLLEHGICFEFDAQQGLPGELPADMEGYRSVLVDDPLLDELEMGRLDRYVRDGGQVWRLFDPTGADADAQQLGLLGQMMIDTTTHDRAHVLLRHQAVEPDRVRLRAMQARVTPESQMDRLVGQVEQWLNRLRRFQERTYQYWSVARVLIEAGHEELLPAMRESMEACLDAEMPFHADGMGGVHQAFWLGERDQRDDWVEKARWLVKGLCDRRPRNGQVLAGTGFRDDPLGLTTDEPLHFRLMVSGYKAAFWTETVRVTGSVLAAMAASTGEARYVDECERMVTRLERSHLRADGLLAHCSVDEGPADADSPVWNRGVGHACYGLLSMLEALPAELPVCGRIQTLLTRILRGMIPYQDEGSGLWRNIVDMPVARLESSGTLAMTCVMYQGLRDGWLDEATFGPVAERAFEGLWQVHWHGGLCSYCRGTAASPQAIYYLSRMQGWSAGPYLVMAISLRKQWLDGAGR